MALAYENDPNSDQFTDTSAGGLVDVIDSRMQFSSMLSNGNAGLLRALDPMRGGEELDGIGPYSPDSDSPYDIAVLATLAENKPMALKRRGKQSLATLHGFFEQGDRYDAVTGRNSFRSLSRLMIGLSSAAVDSTHSAARMSTAQNGFRSRELDDEGALDTIVALRTFDRYNDRKKQVTKKATVSALARGLTDIGQNNIRPSSDACIVVSDFVSGAQRNTDNSVARFDWQRPLANLADLLGDKLFVVRLVSPAQTELPYAARYSASGKIIETDMDQYQRLAEQYNEAGKLKAKRISECLQGIRSIELGSTDKSPFTKSTDFIFGTPRE